MAGRRDLLSGGEQTALPGIKKPKDSSASPPLRSLPWKDLTSPVELPKCWKCLLLYLIFVLKGDANSGTINQNNFNAPLPSAAALLVCHAAVLAVLEHFWAFPGEGQEKTVKKKKMQFLV